MARQTNIKCWDSQDTQIGIPELTRLMCGVDNAISNSYLPEQVTFHRNGLGNRPAEGALACHFVLENHAPEPKPQERGREGTCVRRMLTARRTMSGP
jgi:hypothetical protein